MGGEILMKHLKILAAKMVCTDDLEKSRQQIRPSSRHRMVTATKAVEGGDETQGFMLP